MRRPLVCDCESEACHHRAGACPEPPTSKLAAWGHVTHRCEACANILRDTGEVESDLPLRSEVINVEPFVYRLRALGLDAHFETFIGSVVIRSGERYFTIGRFEPSGTPEKDGLVISDESGRGHEITGGPEQVAALIEGWAS